MEASQARGPDRRGPTTPGGSPGEPLSQQEWGRALFPLLLILLLLLLLRLPLATGSRELAYPLDSKLAKEQPWKLLLPVDCGGGRYRWTPTGYVVIDLLNRCVPAPRIFVGLLILLVVVSYVGSWLIFRSRVFSSTLAICLGFGSQFNYSYIHNGGHLWVLYSLYMLINLFFLCALATWTVGLRNAKIGFVVSLVLFALCWEQWLDYLVFLLTGCGFFYLLCRRFPEVGRQYLDRVRFVALSTFLVAVAYLAGKLPSTGEHFTPGHESDTIFTYPALTMGVEDVLSNLFTYPYIAATSFLPSCFVSSNSLYHFGAEKLVQEQHGYHPEQTHLVVMHHLFFWHYYAGIVFLGFVWLIVKFLRRAWTQPEWHSIFPLVLLWLIATGFATHTIIKFRPYLSVPLLGYKCIGSVVGVALLLSYGLMRSVHLFADHRKYVVAILGVWVVILIAAVDRFPHNSHLSQQVGLGEFPSPTQRVKKLIHRAFDRSKDHERTRRQAGRS